MFNQKEYLKQYYQDNKEKIKARSKQRRLNNPEYMKQWFLANPGCSKQSYQKHKKARLKYAKKYRQEHKEAILKYDRKYYQEQKRECIERKNIYAKNKRKTDLKFNLSGRMSRAIGESLRKNKTGRHWETLVGYTLNDLIKHLKKTIPEGYTEDDMFNGKLHIDHIIPISIFNYTKSEDINFQRCWALKNLQLLPARENLIKSNRLDTPLQLALAV